MRDQYWNRVQFKTANLLAAAGSRYVQATRSVALLEYCCNLTKLQNYTLMHKDRKHGFDKLRSKKNKTEKNTAWRSEQRLQGHDNKVNVKEERKKMKGVSATCNLFWSFFSSIWRYPMFSKKVGHFVAAHCHMTWEWRTCLSCTARLRIGQWGRQSRDIISRSIQFTRVTATASGAEGHYHAVEIEWPSWLTSSEMW